MSHSRLQEQTFPSGGSSERAPQRAQKAALDSGGLSYRLQASLLMPLSAINGSSKRKENGGELSLLGEAQRIPVSLFL